MDDIRVIEDLDDEILYILVNITQNICTIFYL